MGCAEGSPNFAVGGVAGRDDDALVRAHLEKAYGSRAARKQMATTETTLEEFIAHRPQNSAAAEAQEATWDLEGKENARQLLYEREVAARHARLLADAVDGYWRGAASLRRRRTVGGRAAAPPRGATRVFRGATRDADIPRGDRAREDPLIHERKRSPDGAGASRRRRGRDSETRTIRLRRRAETLARGTHQATSALAALPTAVVGLVAAAADGSGGEQLVAEAKRRLELGPPPRRTGVRLFARIRPDDGLAVAQKTTDDGVVLHQANLSRSGPAR